MQMVSGYNRVAECERTPMPLDMPEIVAAVNEIAPAYGLDRVSLFGSYVRGEATDDSDVDLVVDLGEPLGFRLVGLCDALEARLGCGVDVVCGANKLYPFVRESFENEGVVVYERRD